MGKAIEAIAVASGHDIVLKIGSQNQHEFTADNLKKADVAIEFSTPETAFENVKKCLEAGVPTICGTTAWLQDLEAAKALCHDNHTAFLFASNFSIGVNLFFALNETLAGLMDAQPQYNVEMEEIHHTQKKDAPSGTAITLAEQILAHLGRKQDWVNHATEHPTELGIVSKREDPAPGTHSVKYYNETDQIEIIHTAHSRTGFASGAVKAAEFLAGRKGIYTMKDVLGI